MTTGSTTEQVRARLANHRRSARQYEQIMADQDFDAYFSPGDVQAALDLVNGWIVDDLLLLNTLEAK